MTFDQVTVFGNVEAINWPWPKQFPLKLYCNFELRHELHWHETRNTELNTSLNSKIYRGNRVRLQLFRALYSIIWPSKANNIEKHTLHDAHSYQLLKKSECFYQDHKK